jgi:hypothetical protein
MTWKAKKMRKPIINGFCMGYFILSLNGCKKNFGLMDQLTKRASRPMLCSEVLAAALYNSKQIMITSVAAHNSQNAAMHLSLFVHIEISILTPNI